MLECPVITERRRHPRFSLPVMYTTAVVRRRPPEGGTTELEGHAYDISEGGVRIELDDPLMPGEQLDVRIGLPTWPDPVHVSGVVVWIHDGEDDPGPRRMAIRFVEFPTARDRVSLRRYLREGGLRRAA